MPERTQYPRHAPDACQAVTAKGVGCTRLGREVAVAVNAVGEPHGVRLCRIHEHQIDRVFDAGQPFPILMVDGTTAEIHPPEKEQP